jgi:hypothetical protein
MPSNTADLTDQLEPHAHACTDTTGRPELRVERLELASSRAGRLVTEQLRGDPLEVDALEPAPDVGQDLYAEAAVHDAVHVASRTVAMTWGVALQCPCASLPHYHQHRCYASKEEEACRNGLKDLETPLPIRHLIKMNGDRPTRRA